MKIQLRTREGLTTETEDMSKALHELISGKVDKISWNGPDEASRFILWWDGTWEYRAP